MKCDRVTGLLADYFGGLLSPEESGMVKAHLARCQACREEARFLKKYIKETASFPSVEAPDDFLESIHRRISTPEKSGIIRKLFFPPLVKIPLEAAALLALGVTGILLFKPFPGHMPVIDDAGFPHVIEEKSVTARPESARDERVALKPARQKAVVKQRPAEPAGARVAEGFATSEDEAADSVSSAGKPSVAAKPAQVTLYLARNGISGDDAQLRSSDGARKLERAPEDVVRYNGEAASRVKDTDKSLRSSAAAPAVRGKAGADSIAALAYSMNGTVIRKTCDERSGACRQITVEIPAGSYDDFVDTLRGGWNVRAEAPASISPAAGRVRIILNISD